MTRRPEQQLQRAIACIISWLDEEHTEPVEYEAVSDGGFEAFACNSDEQISLGLFETCDQAVRAIWRHSDQRNQLDCYQPKPWEKAN
jgi:hypothetical protein